jgi:nucleotide-binding universal stress UspA family protein
MAAGTFARIAVAVDGSPNSAAALDAACELAQKFGSAITVLTVAPLGAYLVGPEPYLPTEVIRAEVDQYREILKREVERVQQKGIRAVTGVCLEGHVTDEIVAFLERNPADLLVMGSRGLSLSKRLLVGSTSDAVLHHAGCTVMIVRVPETGATRPEPRARSGPRPRRA